MEEKNKENKVVEEVNSDSDFSDEVKFESKEVVVEGKKPEEFEKEQSPTKTPVVTEEAKKEIAEAKEKSKQFQTTKMVGKKEVIAYEYPDDRLAEVEKARDVFNKSYGKTSLLKAIVSLIALVAIIVGWIVPTTLMKDNSSLALTITLIIAVVGIATIAVFSFIAKKKNKEGIRQYFSTYYDNVNAFAFDGLDIKSLSGCVDCKITKEEMEACGLFPDVKAVGSRDNISFKYKEMDCSMADAAAQKDSGRALVTVFVGKYLRCSNNLKPSSPLVIYFKGNERALKPESLAKMNLLEENSSYAVYGSVEDKKILNKELKTALKTIHTDRLLVDLSISIQEGRSYFAIGYEDDLMILPMKEPFNPYFVTKYKESLATILELASLFSK